MKNILLVIDMQNGFARYEQTIQLTDKIRSLLELQAFDAVVATRFLNASNSIYEKLFHWEHLKSEKERQLASGYEEHMDFIVDKYIYNCVNPSFLQRVCQLNDGEYPEQIFLAGADTDCCVLTTAINLFENNIRPVVLTQYCASNGGPAAHQAGLQCLKRLIGSSQLVDAEIHCREDLKGL